MALSKSLILLIEDEKSQIELLRYNLETEGYQVAVAMDGEDGILKARELNPDLILLDWMLPKVSGVEVCRIIRRDTEINQIPVIMLTARSEDSDKVRGLDVGADDFVTKPYSVLELIARVNAAMRRPRASIISEEVSVGSISINVINHQVRVEKKLIELGPTEYRLLITLMKQPDRVFSRDQLLDMVWGISADIDTRTVDVHVGRLRKVLKQAIGKDTIRTVRGFGYALRSE